MQYFRIVATAKTRIYDFLHPSPPTDACKQSKYCLSCWIWFRQIHCLNQSSTGNHGEPRGTTGNHGEQENEDLLTIGKRIHSGQTNPATKCALLLFGRAKYCSGSLTNVVYFDVWSDCVVGWSLAGVVICLGNWERCRPARRAQSQRWEETGREKHVQVRQHSEQGKKSCEKHSPFFRIFSRLGWEKGARSGGNTHTHTHIQVSS